MKTAFISWRPLSSKNNFFLKSSLWKDVHVLITHNIPVAFAWVSFLCPALVPSEFWAELSGDKRTGDHHGNTLKNAHCRRQDLLLYPCESSDDLWTCRLTQEWEGRSQCLTAAYTVPIKNVSYVNWGTLDIVCWCTALTSGIFRACCWDFPWQTAKPFFIPLNSNIRLLGLSSPHFQSGLMWEPLQRQSCYLAKRCCFDKHVIKIVMQSLKEERAHIPAVFQSCFRKKTNIQGRIIL